MSNVYSHRALVRAHDVMRDRPGMTAREIGEVIYADPERVRKLLKELKARGAATCTTERRTVRATRSMDREVIVWHATGDTVPELAPDAWRPQPYVNPIRARALGLPVTETERMREVWAA